MVTDQFKNPLNYQNNVIFFMNNLGQTYTHFKNKYHTLQDLRPTINIDYPFFKKKTWLMVNYQKVNLHLQNSRINSWRIPLFDNPLHNLHIILKIYDH